MMVPVLAIMVGSRRVGELFMFEAANAEPVMRFVADENYGRTPLAEAPVLSIGMRETTLAAQQALWADVGAPAFNAVWVERGAGKSEWQLPAWFQGLLPEGVFRDFVAREAGCSPNDHFRLLIACGKDLPGNVWAISEQVDRERLQRLLTQDQDALEMTVAAEQPQEAISLSGIQPKLAVRREANGRYSGRTKLQDTHIIAKLPTADFVRMPQVEHLSLSLASAAGVTTCEHRLEPLERLLATHDYDLGDEDQPHFLAVERFDRIPGGRVHVETIAQAFDVPPIHKYTHSYLEIAALLMALPLCGEPAVHELLRRLAVNELLGNFDAHLANWGLIYRNGIDAELSPAYDIVAHSVWTGAGSQGHALHIVPPAIAEGLGSPNSILKPATVRRFCDRLGIAITPAASEIRRTLAAAHKHWPEMIAESGLTEAQKGRLLRRLEGMPGGRRKKDAA